MNNQKEDGWIGVDLDGTLAHYDGWRGNDHIGEPIKPMLARVRRWLRDGLDVRIFTARVACIDDSSPQSMIDAVLVPIQNWCEKHVGQVLPVTCCKDMRMIELWDDRCKQVIPNEGILAVDKAWRQGRQHADDRLMDLFAQFSNKIQEQ